MSNNAAVSADGGEIGRAQWLQSLAARVPSSVHMNPVLLEAAVGCRQPDHSYRATCSAKPKGATTRRLKPKLMGAVMESFGIVSVRQADLVVVEGAGSPAEINLRAGDIANMGFATRANVPVVLVGDIDRGGVIASLVGTHAILPERRPRAWSAGYLINKFRGDVTLFDERHFGDRPLHRLALFRRRAVVEAVLRICRRRIPSCWSGSRKGRGRALEGGRARPAAHRQFRRSRSAQAAEPQVDLVFVRPGERIPADAGLVVIPDRRRRSPIS